MPTGSIRRAIVTGGAIAGTIDILYATLFLWAYRGATPERVLQSVAGGVLGKSTFDGGAATAALGLALHFAIATTWAALFVVAARRVRALTDHAVPAGLLYGLGVYAFMNYVVLPLCALHAHAPTDLAVAGTGIAVHAVGIGLTIALCARRFMAPRAA